MFKTPLRKLFDKTNFNDVKKQLYPPFRGYLIDTKTRPDFNGTLM